MRRIAALACSMLMLTAASDARAQDLTLPSSAVMPPCAPAGVTIGGVDLPDCEAPSPLPTGLQDLKIPAGVPMPTCAPAGTTVNGVDLPDCTATDYDPCRIEGPMMATAFALKRPGDAWEEAGREVCARVHWLQSGPTGTPYASWSLVDRRTGRQDLAATFPSGTRFSLTLTNRDAPPAIVHGTMADPVIAYHGRSAVIQALATPHTFPLSYGPGGSCDGQTVSQGGTVSGTLTFGDSPLRGSFFATNAASSGQPTPAGGGAFDVFLAGCGDKDPSTLEGFFQGFIPSSALGVEAALAPLADDLVQVINDGVVQTKVDVEPARRSDVVPFGVRIPSKQVPDGITLEYHLSYSEHTVRVRPDRKLLKAARRCLRTDGRPRVRGGRILCRR